MSYRSLLTFLGLLIIPSLLVAQKSLDYGKAKTQIEALNLDCLHAKGFTGKGVTIAHFDDGFDNIQSLEAFQYARDNKLFKGDFDFVFNKENIDADGVGAHGLQTVSVVNAYLPGEYIGAAFDANMLLAHTEDTRSETHAEEENWRRAVDWAHKNGVDIITSSLQYNEFDEGQGNYTYKDMDGNSTIITKAADYAASKGILVVAIQGNFGSDPWYYVTAPGDADSVITVGAVTGAGQRAGFSSFGPTSDKRIKPDVVAVGARTMLVNPDGSITPSNGTSYAGPAVAGLAACLLQAHPDRSNMEVISAIRQSADRYLKPDVEGGYGHGIPDACRAHEILTQMDETFPQQDRFVVRDQFKYIIEQKRLLFTPIIKKKSIKNIALYHTTGEKISVYKRRTKAIPLADKPSGHYFFHLALKDGSILVENFLLK